LESVRSESFHLAAHCFNVATQRCEQHIAAPRDARNGVLSDAQARGKVLLRSFGCPMQIFQRRQFAHAPLDLRAPLDRQSG